MTDWSSIITRALKELNADTTLTRGAILRNKVVQISDDEGVDFVAYLEGSNQRFVSVVEKVDNVVIRRRPHTDMFVGLEGADWPDSAGQEIEGSGKRFRADVYEAFTRINDRTYWYFPDTDEFTKNVFENDLRVKVGIPPVTLEDLLSQRRAFAEQSEATDELLKAIERSPNPLAAFHAAIGRQRLVSSWNKYNSERLADKIESWANSNGIDFRAQWIDSSRAHENPQSPQEILAHFSSFMTDDEIRAVSVPFRAVEAMYRKINNSTGNSS